MFGEPVTFIGYPTAEGNGNGNLIYSAYTFAVSSGSEHKDTVWKFISTLLSEEGQMRLAQDFSTISHFPIKKDVLEYHHAYHMENTTGYYVLWQATEGREEYFYRFPERDMKEEDIQPVRNLIYNADTALRTSPAIDQIIEEEAAFYFSGAKPLEEVVEVIENRVRTYVNEAK